MANEILLLLLSCLCCSCLAESPHWHDGGRCIAEGCRPEEAWIAEETDGKMAVQMVQMKGSKKRIQKAETGVQHISFNEVSNSGYSGRYLAEVTMLGVDQQAGCTATFKIGSSDLVVKEAAAKKFGYHFGDLASNENFDGLNGDVKSVNIIGCCDVTVYTKLNFLGTSKTYKQGTHADVMQGIRSIKFEPGVCVPPTPAPLVGAFAEFPECGKTNEEKNGLAAMQDMMRDTRKCEFEAFGQGGCRTKRGPSDYAPMCRTDESKIGKGKFTTEFCKKSCLQMKAIGIGMEYHNKKMDKLLSCRCYMAGPNKYDDDEQKGPNCPCGWGSQHGSDGLPDYKRGDVIAGKNTYAHEATKCAGIKCDGPEPPPPELPPTPAPAPFVGVFADFPECPKSGRERYGMAAMQDMMRDTRKCEFEAFGQGDCRTKRGPSDYAPMCRTDESKIGKGKFTTEFCKKSCLQMKAIGIGMEYHNKKMDKLLSCRCYMAMRFRDPDNHDEGPYCPCGWGSQHGSDGLPNYKRGDVIAGKNTYAHEATKCAGIKCDGPEPAKLAPLTPPWHFGLPLNLVVDPRPYDRQWWTR